MSEGGGSFLHENPPSPANCVGRRSFLRKRVLFLFLTLLLASAAAFYTLNAIAPLPLPRLSLENGSTQSYSLPEASSQGLPWP